MVVENKPGASGNIGTQYAATRPPDGHTLMMTVSTFVMNVSLFKSVPYDPQKKLAPIVEAAVGALALAVHPSVPTPSVRALIDHARANPGKLNYAGTEHLAMELLKLTAGIDIVHVPYTGSAGAVRDLVGGHVGAMFIPLHTVLPLVKDNQVRLLGIGSEQRSPLAPDVATLAEQGLAGLRDRAVVRAPGSGRHAQRDRGALQPGRERDPGHAQGPRAASEPGATRGGAPDQFAQLIAREQARWARLVKDVGIAPE